MEERQKGGGVVLGINGERFEAFGVHPSTTLLHFLRTNTRFKSAKLTCGEGGCGACVVLLSKYDPVLGKVEDYTVSSCLTLLCSLHNCSITTSDGLGNSIDGFHPIHERFSGFHASQCGFCTPGMCMSLFSAIVNAEKEDRPEPPSGFSKLTVSEAEKCISGNLCRCTGYRPIVDACKSFAADVDMEDLGTNSFWRMGESNDAKLSRLPLYNSHDPICTYPDFLKKEVESAMPLSSDQKSWYTPLTLEELNNLLENNFGTRTRLVVGNTGMGYYKELGQYDEYIDLRHLSELSSITRDETGITIGATVTISKAILALMEEVEGKVCTNGELIFHKIAAHMEMIASKAVRNLASVGGNVVLAQRNSFPSDIVTVLLAVDTRVHLMVDRKNETITLQEFLSRSPLDPRGVLVSLQVPYWGSSNTSLSTEADIKLLFKTYRAAPRPLGNALPYLNAAFAATVSPSRTGVVINDIRLAFGAFGTKHAIRATKFEEFLLGKNLNAGVLSEAFKLTRSAVVPEDGTAHATYRSSLAVGYVFDFLYPLVAAGSVVSNGWLIVNFDDFLEKAFRTAVAEDTLLSSGKQFVNSSKEYYPIGEPVIKFGASLQASGEAVYVDDIPSPPNCLHGAFVYSTKPLARVKSVNFNSNSLPDGVTAVISYNDIPKRGENIGSKSAFGTEPLFADDLTRCTGQRLALVVADTQKNADKAASMAVVDYDAENLEQPILTVEQAVEKSSFFEVPDYLSPAQVGDFSKGMAEADQKILSAELKLGSQYYFYMESQTALAIPDEDNCMVVYSSTQAPEYAQTTIAGCLGIPERNVRVITRRVGGGFGGKSIKSLPIATACALAAYKLRRPVRMYLNRKTDMIMAGGRHPMKITYDVGFKSDGTITALNLNILINSGMSIDLSPIMPHNMVGVLRKYDWGALSFDIKLCKTNHSSKSAMRGPGEVQASFIAEAVIEHVSSTLSMEVDSVRYKNLHTFDSLTLFYKDSAGELVDYTLPYIWDKLATSSSFNQRIEMIQVFNERNVWKKKGISRVPIVHQATVKATPGKVSILSDGSIVVEVGGIELGQGLWTKVSQMTAYALRSIQCDGTADLLDKVRVVQSDTLSLIQGGTTSGSTTSESSCEAVRQCCSILVERLAPVKEKLEEQMSTLKWETLISQAKSQSVNLSAISYFVPESTSTSYLNYGAAVSEVEIDLLTGETRILRSDIIYDCGQSLNPAVDLGQIEGAFVQGVGFFMLEEYLTNSDGLVVADSTWTYKIPTVDTIPKQFNVEVLNSGHHKHRVLSSKASGEPPLLLAVSVHTATRAAIKEARKQLRSWNKLDEPDSTFYLDVPATMPVVKQLCGIDNVETYLQYILDV